MASANDVIKQQRVIQTRLKTVYDDFMSTPVNNHIKGMAQAELQRLEELFNTFNANHTQLLKHKNVDMNDDYFTSEFLIETENCYYRNRGRFNNLFLQYDLTHSLDKLADTSSERRVRSELAGLLLTIKLPEFSGKHTDW